MVSIKSASNALSLLYSGSHILVKHPVLSYCPTVFYMGRTGVWSYSPEWGDMQRPEMTNDKLMIHFDNMILEGCELFELYKPE